MEWVEVALVVELTLAKVVPVEAMKVTLVVEVALVGALPMVVAPTEVIAVVPVAMVLEVPLVHCHLLILFLMPCFKKWVECRTSWQVSPGSYLSTLLPT